MNNEEYCERVSRAIEEHFARDLENYHALWDAGMWAALDETITYCRAVNIPLPEWARRVIEEYCPQVLEDDRAMWAGMWALDAALSRNCVSNIPLPEWARRAAEEFFNRFFEGHRAMWEEGMWPALSEAISCYRAVHIPPPEWAYRAQQKIEQNYFLGAAASTRRGRCASPKERLRADLAHYLRWLAVGVVLMEHDLTDLPSKKGPPPPGTATKARLLAEAADRLRQWKKAKLARLSTDGELGTSFQKVQRSFANGEARFKFDDLLTIRELLG